MRNSLKSYNHCVDGNVSLCIEKYTTNVLQVEVVDMPKTSKYS